MATRRIIAGLAVAMLGAGAVVAGDLAIYLDKEVVAVGARTGEPVWSHRPGPLRDAYFDVYEVGLVAHCFHADNAGPSRPVFLDLGTGKAIPEFSTDEAAVLASSRPRWPPWWPPPAVVLENGWRLCPGESKEILFFAPPGEHVNHWTIPRRRWTGNVRGWKDIVLIASPYTGKDLRILAYRAGAAEPLWVLDPRGQVPLERDSAVYFEILDDLLFGQIDQHVFTVAPASGTLLWRCDLAKSLGLRFHPHFCNGGTSYAFMAKHGDLLVVAYECGILAIDLAAESVLWHFVPDMFPLNPYPAIHGGLVYLTCGPERSPVSPGRRLHRVTFTWGFKTRTVVLVLTAPLAAAGLGLAWVLLRRPGPHAVRR